MAMTLSQLRDSGLDLLSDLEPWSCLSSKELARRLDVDPCLIPQWRYRGICPAALPDEITLGRAVVHFVADWQSWLDPSTSPLERLRHAVVPIFDDAASGSTGLVLLYAAVMSENAEPTGFKFARNGREHLRRFILSRKNDYETTK